jgi:hypothetical protein
MLLTNAELRDYLLRIHDLATGQWLQSDTELRRRIARVTEAAISHDDVMQGFLGAGGPDADRNLIGGSGLLDDPRPRDEGRG